MIKFIGKNTNNTCKWEVIADSYYGIYSKLVDKGVISSNADYDPVVKYVLEQNKKKEEDFNIYDEDGDIDYDKSLEYINEFVDEHYPLDVEFRYIIGEERGNAYYQEFMD